VLTVDASVFVAAEIRGEPEHKHARRLLAVALEEDLAFHLPWLAVVEASVAVGRRLGSAEAAGRTAMMIVDFPDVTLHSVDRAVSLLAAAIGATCRLRGADAIYAAVAKKHGTTLITCDNELRERVAGTIEALTPEGWLGRRREP
jgi:predicted nucleic acid-binding protein